MHLIALIFQKHRDKTILVVLVAISIFLLVLPEPTQFSIARNVLNALFVPVERVTNFIGDYVSTREQNQRLKRMVATLMLERERLLQFRDERERLRRLADFKEEQTWKLAAAEVIGRNLDRFQTVLVIDKGSADSLDVMMPVFTYQGLVGRLIQVFPTSSWVQLIRSKSMPVSCIDKRSRVVGILEWRRHNQFELTSVSAVEDVAVGDTLLTSGFGGLIPKGFPVAVVTRVGDASDGLTLRVEALSPVNFLSLEEVFVMTDEVPWDQSMFYDEADTLLMKEILRDTR